MNTRIPYAFVLSLLAISPVSFAQGDYVLEVDSLNSGVYFELETNLGPVSMEDQACTLTGQVGVQLEAGVLPVESCLFEDGDVECLTPLSGIVPNVLPHLPPLLEIDIVNLHLEPNSDSFPVAANGLFCAASDFVVLDGLLVLRALGEDALHIPLVGGTFEDFKTQGRIRIDEDGTIVISRTIGNDLYIDVPLLGLELRLGLRGGLVAEASLNQPSIFCTAAPNSTGLSAEIDAEGFASATLNNLVLGVDGCPGNTAGLFFYGSVGAEVSFGDGFLCATGPTMIRLDALVCDGNGSATFELDLDSQVHLDVGTTWAFQFHYRDPNSDGVGFNTSNALRVEIQP